MLRILSLTAGCLLLALASCDSEKYDASRNSTTSSRRVTQTTARDPANDFTALRHEQLTAANKDPEFRRHRERYEALLNEREKASRGEEIFWGPSAAEAEFAEYYALHYPDLGIGWLASHPGAPFGHFITTLYRADPEKSFLQLQSLPKGETRDAYALEYCRVVRGEDIGRVWQLLENATGDDPQNPLALKVELVGAQARSDPMAAWETWQSRISNSENPQNFLAIIPPLDDGTVFPAQLIERIPEGEARVSTVLKTMEVCRTPTNAAPLIAWLAAQSATPAYDKVYSRVATWQTATGDPAESERWTEKISDPIVRERSRSSSSELREALDSVMKQEQERLRNPE